MAVNRLCAAFRQITLKTNGNVVGRYCSTQISQDRYSAPPFRSTSRTNLLDDVHPVMGIKFIPRSLNIDIVNPDSSGKKGIIEVPVSKYIPSMEEPVNPRPIWQDLPVNKSLELPTLENVMEKLAIRLIVIRRKKMKKHKRRKLRKRMHYVLAKIRARRNVLKEKLFQAEVRAKLKEAHMFDAKAYVQDRLAILDKERLPRTYMGEILPQDMIRDFLQKGREKREKRLNKPRLTLD